MEKNIRSERSLILITIIIILLILIAYFIINSLNRKDSVSNMLDNNVLQTINYTTTYQGDRINTSLNVLTEKKVGNIIIEKSQIVYKNGVSKLTSKVTNGNIKKDNLRFLVKFLSNDGTVIAESVGFAGKIDNNETKYIDSYITYDVSKSSNVIYELM